MIKTLGTFFSILLLANSAQAFEIQSLTFAKDGPIPPSMEYGGGFGCEGPNISPQVSWINPPAGTKSYALLMFDPDAPDGGWWHWIVYNIPGSVMQLEEGKAPYDQGRTDYSTPGYGGVCPPQGDKPHRYVISLYALEAISIDIPRHPRANDLLRAIKGYVLGKATYVGTYQR